MATIFSNLEIARVIIEPSKKLGSIDDWYTPEGEIQLGVG